ncbi:hypothetical protein [Undibacter mobilis]|uniref:hypothetical protein n=1 Tax=Undibacter mobilis TaxID=2292256 RepID=UPI001AECD8C2|nr:hypothetical protein [Undibacter mobilis]
MAAMMLDNVWRLDETVGRVTDFVMSNKPDRDTVVVLQSFDRLKQEFEALAETLARYAQAHSSTPESGEARTRLGHDVIGDITVADLKERLLSRLQPELDDVMLPEISPEQAAEIGRDVVY